MANELSIVHQDPALNTEAHKVSEAEYKATDQHTISADGQTAGDVLYFNGTNWVRGTVADLDFSGLPTSDPHLYGRLFVDAGGTIQVSAG